MQSGNNSTKYNRVITLGKECTELCDGRADSEIKELIISRAKADEDVVYSDGSVK